VNSAAGADNASPAAATVQHYVMLAARVGVEAASAEAPSPPSASSRGATNRASSGCSPA
jgi:hypothetical protein